MAPEGSSAQQKVTFSETRAAGHLSGGVAFQDRGLLKDKAGSAGHSARRNRPEIFCNM